MSHDENENKMNAIFSQVKAADLECPPYLKTRVLAQLRQEREYKRKLFIWQFVSFGSLTALIATFFIGFHAYQTMSADATIRQAYVIHVDFTQTERNQVAKAEIELPDGVRFVSKTIRPGVHKLVLPVKVAQAGPGKLPFVVRADSAGEKRIVIRLLNRDDQVIREQILNYRFAEANGNIL